MKGVIRNLIFCIIIFISCSQKGLLETDETEVFPPIPLEVGTIWNYEYGDSILTVSIFDTFTIENEIYHQIRCNFSNDVNGTTYYYLFKWDKSCSTLFRYKGNKAKYTPIMCFNCCFKELNKESDWGRCKTRMIDNDYYYNGYEHCKVYEIKVAPEYDETFNSVIKPGIGFVFDSTFGELKNYKLK